MAKPKDETLILIADSDQKSLHVIAILLHKLGYVNILEASDREDAEKIIKERSRDNTAMSGLLGGSAPKETTDIDLVMIDADIAKGGGLRLVADLRKRFGADKPAVMFTARDGRDETFASALQAGANDAILKPFSKDMLGIKLNVLLGAEKAPMIKSFSFTASASKPFQAPVKPKKEEPAQPAQTAAVKINGPAPAQPSTGGVSFMSRGGKKTYSADGEPTAVLVNGKIDGHYHEQVNVIGGGQNCYWARRLGEQEKVRLEYLSAKGQPTGMEAKVIPLGEFMHTFVLCDESNCPIMARLGGERK